VSKSAEKNQKSVYRKQRTRPESNWSSLLLRVSPSTPPTKLAPSEEAETPGLESNLENRPFLKGASDE
jgi:hypothetical protein